MKKIIIIGSGIGGLVAGNLLAKKGHRVTIFESHSSPGGYTAGFWKKGFYFESGTLSFESSDMVFKAMKEIGVFERIKFTRQRISLRAGEIDGVCESYIDLKNLFYSTYPSEKTRLNRYFAEVDKMGNKLMAIMQPHRIVDFLLYPFYLMNFFWLYKKYERITITDFAARYFDRDSIFYSFFKSLGYPDMSAAIISPAFMSFFDDYWTVADGMQSWADMLAENFRALGGDLRLDTRVTKIITKNGAAIGIGSKGNEHYADYIISAADYKKTFLHLLDDKSLLPNVWLKKVEKTAVSEGIFTVYLGLNLPNDDLRRYLNPKLAPDGKSSLMIQAVAPHKWLNNWGGGDRQKYCKLKEAVKRILIEKVSVIIPDLKNHIEFEDAATPLTYEKYTHNTDGATSAWSWNPKNKFYKNIISVNVDTPIKNLYIGSCWAMQIGGVPGAIAAACKCVKKIRD